MADGSGDGRNSDTYWAAESRERIGNAIASKLRRDADDLVPLVVQRRQKWRDAYMAFYGFGIDGRGNTSRVTRAGDQGAESNVRVNYARSVAKALLGLLVSQRFSWKPTARNSDVGARAAVQDSSVTLEWLWKTERMQRVVRHWVELSILSGATLCWPEWDQTRGEAAAADEEGTEFAGELRFNLIPPWRFHVDENARSFEDSDWCAVGIPRNKWSMMALYPKDILGEDTHDAFMRKDDRNLFAFDQLEQMRESDQHVIVHFFHRRTPALPDGRHVIMVGEDTVLADGPLDYWPLVRLAADEQHETPHGYSSWWDVLGIQEETDALESSIASNQLTFGTQSVVMEEDSSKKQISRLHGLKVFWKKASSAFIPQALQLTATPKEIFTHLDRLRSHQRDLSGMNDVAMGQSPNDTAQMNAQAFSLLASMAQQRNAPQLQEVVDAIGELGGLTLKLLAKHWTEKKRLAVSGNGSAPQYHDVDPKNFGELESTPVETGNPLEQSAAGRMQLVSIFAQAGVKLDAQQIEQVVSTGRLEHLTQPIRDASLYVAFENDELRSGRVPQAHWSDDHFRHVREAKAVLDSPEARTNLQVVKAVSAHVGEHYALFWGLPPTQPDGSPTNPQADPQWPIRIRIMLGQDAPPTAGPPPGPPPGGPPPGPPPPALNAGPPQEPSQGAPPAVPPPVGHA